MLPDLSTLPVLPAAGLLAACAAVIAVAGTRLASVADRLADRTGMGEILAGAVFIGGSTSLPGAITSMSTAADGHAQLAIGNAVGGLTVQTAFLAIADLVYRRANLEHAAASPTALTQGALLISLLSLPLLAAFAPEVAVLGVHPVSLALVVAYGAGLRLLMLVKREPMWRAVPTRDTESELDEPTPESIRADPNVNLWRRFALLALVLAVAGWAVGEASIALVEATKLSATAVGTIFTAIANSLPELVTAIAAVRRGAVHLAVGDIVGGNSFEVLFLAAADVFYRGGSIYHRFTYENGFTVVLAILMTGVIQLGLVRRERRGIGGIGFESAIVLVLYGCSVALLLT